MQNIPVKKHALSGDLTLITVPRRESLTATVLVLVETGSKYESKRENGISHFLEHMCFKGTKKRPRAIDISSELDALGASYNAFTGHEFTGYYAKVNPLHIEKALDVVADIYINQIFRPQEIAREARVILEEMHMNEDSPRRKVYDAFTTLLYGNQPAGWDIIGTKKTVLGITKRDLERYRRAHYVSHATTVVVAGRFNEQHIVRSVAKHFRHMRKGKKHEKPAVTERQTEPRASVVYRKTDQTHAILGFRTFPLSDKRVPVLKVLASLLGGGMSSRLFHVVREQMGAAYYVSAFEDLYTDHGYMGTAFGAGHNKLTAVIRVVLKECRRLRRTAPPAREVRKVKDYLVGKLANNLETTDELADFTGMQYVLEKRMKSPKEIMRDIEQVTPVDVRRLARDIFIEKGLNLALIGPYKDAGRFVPLLRL